MKKGIVKTITAILVIALGVFAQTIEDVANTINAVSGLTAATSGNVVTVTGTATNNASLTLNIPEDGTVVWQAELVGNVSLNNALINLTGTGTFNMESGSITHINNGMGRTINNESTGTVNVLGGTVHNELGNYNAIRNEVGGIVNVSGGTVSVWGGQAIDNVAAGTINASGGTIINIGGVTAIRNFGTGTITVSGNAIITAATVVATSGVIHLADAAGTLNVTGGTVQHTAISANARAIYNAGAATVNISGGTVSVAGAGRAIHNHTAEGSINITGGLVRAATGHAFFANGNVGNLTVSNDAVLFAHGTASGDVISHTDFSGITGNSAVIAWNGTGSLYTTGSNTGLVLSTEASATEDIAVWGLQLGKAGIAYTVGSNTGFFEVSGVGVGANSAEGLKSLIENAVAGLTAVVDNNTVTVTSTELLTNNATFTLNIPSDLTVVWEAELTGSTSAANSSIINLTGTGTFNMASGTIAQTSAVTTSRAITNQVAGTLNVSGGTVSATAGRAIHNQVAAGSVTISGGLVRATTGFAFFAGNAGTLTVRGNAVLFAHGTASDNVVSHTGFNTAGSTENSAVIAWSGAVGDLYITGSNDDLVSMIYGNDNADIATWDVQNGKAGISYTVGSNNGFIEIFGIAVGATPAEVLKILIENAVVGLTATIDGNTITVTSTELLTTNATLSLNIPADLTVVWKAELTGNTIDAITSIINLTGEGTFNMESGRIAQTGTSNLTRAITNNSGTLNVSGGVISATAGTAIHMAGAGIVNISGTAMISSASTLPTAGTIATSNTGALNITGGTVENTASNANARAIYSIMASGDRSVNVSGGTVRAIGSGVAIFNDWQAAVNVSGTALIEVSGGAAIRSGSNSTGNINISGGLVRATTGFAYSSEATNNINLSVSGDAILFAYGGAINNIVVTDNANVNRSVTEDAIIIAWNSGTNVVNAFSNNGLVVEGASSAVWLNKGDAGIRVTGDGSENFFAVSGVTVNKIDLIFPTTNPVTYEPTKTLADVALLGGDVALGSFAWTDNTIMPTVTVSEYNVTFTANDGIDIENYNVSATKDVTLTVNRALVTEPELSEVSFVYTGTSHEVELSTDNALYSITGGHSQTDAGDYEAIVELTDADNYIWVTQNDSEELKLSWAITQATVTDITTIVANASKTAFEAKDAEDHDAIIALFDLPSNVDVTISGDIAQTLPIVWATSVAYDAKDAEYVFTGTLTGNANIDDNGVTAEVTVTITPIEAEKPTFNEVRVIVSGEDAATASDLGTSVLPTSGSISVEGQNVAYEIVWGSETLDRTAGDNYQTFTGTINYPNPPEWLTIPADLSVSRLVSIIAKEPAEIKFADGENVYTGAEQTFEYAELDASVVEGTNPVWTYEYRAITGTLSNEKPFRVGTYEVIATYEDDDYFGTKTVTFEITKAPLTWIAGTVNSKPYDRNNAATIANMPTLDGVFGGDVVTVSEGDVAFANVNAGTAVSVTASGGWGITGTHAANYSISGVPTFATAVISPKFLTWATEGTVESKVYDGTTVATVDEEPTLDGVIQGDVVTVSGDVFFADKNVGGDISVTASGWTLGGADGANYTLDGAQPEFANAEISRKPIAVPMLTADDLVYTGSAQAAKIPAGEGYVLSDNAETDAGSYTAIATLDGNHQWDEAADKTETRNIPWSIARKPIAVPTAAAGLVYTGELQTGVAGGTGYIVTSGGSATNAGPYEALLTLDSNHEWDEADDKTETRNVAWSIAKAAGAGTVSLAGWIFGEEANTPVPAGGTGTPTYAYKLTSAEDETYSATVPTNAGAYTIRATFAEAANHLAHTATNTFAIAKALGTSAPDYVAPSALTAKNDETLADVVGLPEGWTWDEAATTPVGATGERTHKATFTSANTNYETVANIDWTITVDDATFIFANPENPKIGAIGVQTYYTLKGTSLGATKPTAPGVYLEKRGKHIRKITIH
ncbi:MAG: YDG domain-containing protein [Fibromonadaceae bacterium]|jgi:hypothetical protein|nr:YDG domain-containing protein [Fibromonadaceae bacterium]